VAYPRKLLNPGEEMVLDLHPHWWYFARQVAALVLAMALAIVAVRLSDVDALAWIGAAIVLAAAAWVAYSYVTWVNTHFVLTTDRLITRRGVVSRSGVQIPLERVNNVNFRQSIFERMIGSGDLIIESAGQEGEQALSNIKKPDIVTNMIHSEMEGNENRKFDRLRGPSMPPPAPPVPDVADQLRKLDELRRQGILTQAEFDAKKAQLLERM
jgi:membrane protein YdbS with pleckstrin-like domain